MRERGKSSGARVLSPDPEKATHLVSHWEPEGDIGIQKSEGDSRLVAFTRHRQSRTDTKDACHVYQTASGATRWEGDIGYVAFKKATHPLSQSIKPEGDIGRRHRVCRNMKQNQTLLTIRTTSRQSPCRDPEDGAKGPRGPGCYT
ncbi:hypothetical protein Taro_007998, partial [Colocasia esculenta]|nr:hypothetical protein [Colocasia esculenta]